MNLSQHFTVGEFIHSSIAARHGINNNPSEQVLDSLKRLAERMEDVRRILGHPVFITSGFRCSKLNKLLGSKPTSSHVQGLACDFVCPQFGNQREIVEKLIKTDLMFDQLILEYFDPNTGDGWVHLGLGSKMRKEVLTINHYGVFSGVYT